MNFKQKRLYKLLSKITLCASYMLIAFAIFQFVYLIICDVKHDTFPPGSGYLLVSSVFLSLGFMSTGQYFYTKRMSYLRKINLYRHFVRVTKTIDFLRIEDFYSAKRTYNSIKESSIKDILFGLIIGMSMYSTDEFRFNHASEKLDVIRKDFNPNDIF